MELHWKGKVCFSEDEFKRDHEYEHTNYYEHENEYNYEIFLQPM